MFQKLHFCHALLGGVAYRPPMKVGAFDGFMGRRCGVAEIPVKATKGWRWLVLHFCVPYVPV
jgi:hypothetical protein